MLADTGAQINCANSTIFDALGIKPEDRDKYLTPSEITVNGVGGARTVVRELKVRIYSLKTKKTHRVTFYVGKMTGNILSESTLYALGYLPENIFREDELYRVGKQKEYITTINANKYPKFGSIGHETIAVMTQTSTQGNRNSGGKKNADEKLKNECKRSQYTSNGTVHCSCPRR